MTGEQTWGATAIVDRWQQRFADRPNAVLVRTTRQLMRAGNFPVVFIITQVAMAGWLSFAALLPMGGRNMMTTGFWSVLGFLALIVIPLQGSRAIRGEMQSQTVELVIITRINILGLIRGIWWALALQTGLLAASLLPYLLVRYWFGGIDIARDCIILISLLGCGLSLAMLSMYAASIRWRLEVIIGLIVTMLFGMMFLPMVAIIVPIAALVAKATGLSASLGAGFAVGALLTVAVYLPVSILFIGRYLAMNLSPALQRQMPELNLPAWLILAAIALALVFPPATFWTVCLLCVIIFQSMYESWRPTP